MTRGRDLVPIQGKRARGAERRAVANRDVFFAQFRRQARRRGRSAPRIRGAARQRRAIKDHTLAHLDLYLEAYEAKVRASGGEVHYAQDADEARKIIVDLCKSMGAKSVTKGKSMIAEEIGLNHALEAAGIEPSKRTSANTSFNCAARPPPTSSRRRSISPAKDVEQEFRKAHRDLPPDRSLAEPEQLLAEARQVLRAKFLAADVGITGANFLIAETGTSIIVTNEGNGDLTQTLPEAHIVIASIEKIVPTLEDAAQLMRVLARSATGQDASVYTTLSTGPRRPGDPDGPRAYHVVILDNGRSAMLGGEFEDMLRCIRCGACMNHCPVYQAVGGHAYGWVYPGPMGAVLTPSLIGVAEGGQLPNASTFCGRCEEVCPVRIPLPGMMRHWREREFERSLSPAPMRYGLGFWAFFASPPGALSIGDWPRRARHASRRPTQGPLRMAALRRRLDALSRSRRAGGGHVPESMASAERSRSMSSRAAVFASIRRSLGVTGDEATRRFEVETRLKQAPPGIVPKRGQGDVTARLATFKAEAERAQASVAEIAGWADAPAEIARFLRENNCPATLRMGDDPRLAGMPWSETTLEIFAALPMAATSTPSRLLLPGSPRPERWRSSPAPTIRRPSIFCPTTISSLLPREAIEADYESVFAKLRGVYGKGGAPRTINFITGPSRSADIEQTLLLGAHGPRRLHIVVVG